VLCHLICRASGSKTRARNVGAVEAIVIAMCEHTESMWLQYQAWQLLHSLIENYAEIVLTEASSVGAVEAVVAAMRMHLGCPKLQQRACGSFACSDG